MMMMMPIMAMDKDPVGSRIRELSSCEIIL